MPLAAGEPRTEPPGDAREDAAAPSPNVHVAYYLWYGTPASDVDWRHWNHKVLPHWEEGTRSRFPHGQPHQPPDDLHSPFFPARGPYSVRNTTVLGEHMEEIRNAGSRVAIASWWGRPDVDGTADTEGVNTDYLLPAVLDAAAAHGVEIAFHLEPYLGRTAALLSEDFAYLARRYGSHPALHRRGGLPVYYVYDSYHVSPADWAGVLCAGRPGSLRGGAADGVFFGLWLDHRHGEDLHSGCFDGFYTYFASEGFSFGSTPARWPEMVRFAHSHGMVAALSVGPGYNDERIRPWCGQPPSSPSPPASAPFAMGLTPCTPPQECRQHQGPRRGGLLRPHVAQCAGCGARCCHSHQLQRMGGGDADRASGSKARLRGLQPTRTRPLPPSHCALGRRA